MHECMFAKPDQASALESLLSMPWSGMDCGILQRIPQYASSCKRSTTWGIFSKHGNTSQQLCCNAHRALHLHAGLQPVLVHMSKNAQGTFSFNPLSINLLVELAKTAFALSILLAVV